MQRSTGVGDRGWWGKELRRVPGHMANGPRVSVRVPAKLNLFLAVRGLRPDGFHELVTVFQTVSLFDHLRAGVVATAGREHHPAARRTMRLELRHDAMLGPLEDNLAVLAARALGRLAGISELAAVSGEAEYVHDAERGAPRTVLELEKGIPVAGGMAGGSADAAATLVALNELWGLERSREHLREVAATIGSDVPFCVVGGTALATGTGTAVAQVLCRGTFHWVIGESLHPLPTGQVYRAWDRHCRPSEVEPDAVLAALRSEDAVALGAALHNDLERAAFALRPELEEQKRALIDAGALGAVLSGSGPTMLALVSDTAEANHLAEVARGWFPRVSVAQSPAGGPDLRSA